MQEHPLIPLVISVYTHVDPTVSQRRQSIFLLFAEAPEACIKYISSGSTDMQTKHVPPWGSTCKYLPLLHVLEHYLHVWHTWKYTSEFSHLFCSYGVLDSCWVFSCAWERDDRERLTLHIFTQPAPGGECRDKELVTLCVQKHILLRINGRSEKTIDRRLLQNAQCIFTHTVAQGCTFLTQQQPGKGHMACFDIWKARDKNIRKVFKKIT